MTIFRFNLRSGFELSLALCLASPLAAQEIADDVTRLVQADKLLNDLYRTRMQQLLPAERLALRKSERHWLLNVSQNCDRVAERAGREATVMGPGAAAQAAERLCRLDATEKRIVVLRMWKTKK